MQIVDAWCRSNDVPITQKYIVSKLVELDFSEHTVKQSVRTLVRKGYLRKSASRTRPVRYVQIRGI